MTTSPSGHGSTAAGPAPLAAAAGGLVAEVVRGDLVESVHLGHLVILGRDGAVRLAVGDPDAPFWARSSLKPLQAVAMLRSGLDPDDADLALVCASHSGTPEHLGVVRGILARAGVDESRLQNTPDLPVDADAAFSWREGGGVASSITQNCSGKHAGMLATCVAAGWDQASYLDPDHPLQRAIRATVEDLTGVGAEHVTVDGCGSPLLSTTLTGLARAFARIAVGPSAAAGSAEARVASAMGRNPRLVGGPGRDVTAFMEAVPGLVAKDGAEGVYAAGLADGSAVAFKIADGGARPRAAVLAAALELMLADDAAGGVGLDGVGSDGADLAAILAAVRDAGRTVVLGHGRPVGEVLAVLGGASGRGRSR